MMSNLFFCSIIIKTFFSFFFLFIFLGLRGAMAFALAIRNTLTEQRHLMLTTTSVIAIVTVFICGGFATQLLAWLGIPYVLFFCFLLYLNIMNVLF